MVYRPRISVGDDYEKYRREKLEEELRYWSSAEGLGLSQEEFEAQQEQNNPWPRHVRTAVDELRGIVDGIDLQSDAEPGLLAERIAALVRPIVEYLEPLVYSLREKEWEEGRRRDEDAVESPWYFEPNTPAHVMTWESLGGFRRSSEDYMNAKRRARQVQSIEALFRATTSLAGIHTELDVAGSDFPMRVTELGETFMTAWGLARHPNF